jgi:ABC-type Fe3+-citrate transport system substrate-binding protein
MSPRIFSLVLVLTLLVLILSACGGGSDEEVTDERKSIGPVVCKDEQGNVIPGNCY